MLDLLNVSSLPIIVAMVYIIMEVYKVIFGEKGKKYLPIVAGTFGAILGVISFYIAPEIMIANNVFSAVLIGIASGLSATGANQIGKQIKKSKKL